MKILMANYSEITCPGGVHKTITEVAKHLGKKNHEIIVLQGNSENLPVHDNHEGFEIIRVKLRTAKYLYGFSPEMYFYLKNNLKDLMPDVVHVHGYHTLFSPELIYLLKKMHPEVPIVFSPHLGLYSHNSFAGRYLTGIYNIIGKNFIKYTDRVIVSSNYELNNTKKILNVPSEKFNVIPHGISGIDLIKRDSNKEEINLLYVGYLLELKGVQYILEALNELIHNKNVKANLTIIGEGPYKKNLKKIADKLDITDFINFKKFIPLSKSEELSNYYKRSDILLLLSQSENYGIVVLEALAMGTPTIVTKGTALEEFLNEPGCFGVNFPPHPAEVAELILKIHRNNIKVGPFSNRISTWDQIAKDYEKQYESICQTKCIQ